MDKVTSVILAGVGGQGILLASSVVARAAMLAGHDVKTNEVHGMAQRGGSVVAEIRYGKTVHSPLIEPGTASALASLEQIEALRYAHYLKPDGLAVVSTLSIIPTTVSSGLGKYPEDVGALLQKAFRRLYRIDTEKKALESGNPRTGNIVLVGALSKGLDLPEEAWEKSIRACVKPQFADVNILAFNLGRKLVE